MTAGLIVLLFASSLVQAPASTAPAAQDNPLGAPGCGPTDIHFDVKTKGKQATNPVPEAGKAVIVFLQDDAYFGSRPRPTTRFGVDGTWVGATHSNSYFFVSIDPGEHHLCANWQSRVVLAPTRSTAAAHFTAEAGRTYYYCARDIAITDQNRAIVAEPEIKFVPLDEDEGKVLMRAFALSQSHPKK